MSYITGNITNLKMPATVGTINSLDIEPNSDECHTIAIIACGGSIITVVVIIACGVVLAVPLQPVLESHGDMTQTVRTNPVLSDFMEKQSYGIGNGPDFFTAAVRREKKLGADFIKIMATGGFATPYDDPDDIQLNDAEFKAIFDTARELKISVTAHVYGPRLMKEIIYPNPEAMKKKSPDFQRKLAIYEEQMRRGREIIVNSKIKLGFGTDFVAAYNNYEGGMEYRCWMESGCDPFCTLEAATKVNAEICEVSHITGTIEPGKFADIAGWSRDLLKDKDALRDCAFVMKEGVMYKTESYIKEQ